MAKEISAIVAIVRRCLARLSRKDRRRAQERERRASEVLLRNFRFLWRGSGTWLVAVVRMYVLGNLEYIAGGGVETDSRLFEKVKDLEILIRLTHQYHSQPHLSHQSLR